MLHIRKVPSRSELKNLEAVDKPCQKPFDSDVLRIVAFSDYRVQDISLLLDFIKKLQPIPNLILYAGDDVERFHNGGTNFFEQLAALSTHGLCAVLGNDPPEDESSNGDKKIRSIPDTKTLRAYIRGINVYNVHETPLVLGKYAVIGSEGSPPDEEFGDLGVVIYSEASIARHLQLAAKLVRGKMLILVSHCPPRRVLDLAIRFGTRHIGSVQLRKFLGAHKNVPLVVCGHVHYCGAQAKKFKGSMVVNAASHDNVGAPGRIAIIEIRAGKICHVQWHHIWELGSLCGIKEARASRLKDAGISNLAQLADAPSERIKQVLKCGSGEASSIKAKASSLLKQDAIVFKPLEIPDRNRTYIDIETDPNSKFVWLIGLHVEEEARTYSFFADTPAHEKDTLTSLLQFLNGRPELQLLSYSNSAVEQRLLLQRFSAHNLPTVAVQHIRDIYYEIHSCAAFPVENSTLKDISRWCGFKARYPDMDGWGAALSYGSGKPNKRVKQMLLAYNEDDILSLKHVVQYIENRTEKRAASAHATSGESLSLF
jgi:Icc-related predicted phosphoesterase/uncharacterized protein YprB with RNaseH-like and TPR domain